jgi:uncharacterized membrane protein
MALGSGRRTVPGLLAFGLLVAGIPAWITLDKQCPALTVVPVSGGSIDVPMLTGYSAFIADNVKSTGGNPTFAISDWEPWLQAYPIGALAAIGLVPVFVLVSIIGARTTALTAAAVLASAGVVASVVYALRLQGYANQNTLTDSKVNVGRCAAPTLFAGALLTQLALLAGVRYAP